MDMNPGCRVCKGACCEDMELNAEFPRDPVFEEWLEARGFEVMPDGVRFPFRCPELLRNGKCGIWTTRPAVCVCYAPGSAGCVATVKRRRHSEQVAAILEALSL
jgi:hypothetical protein